MPKTAAGWKSPHGMTKTWRRGIGWPRDGSCAPNWPKTNSRWRTFRLGKIQRNIDDKPTVGFIRNKGSAWPPRFAAAFVLVSVREHIESLESVVIQGWWPDSRRVTDVDGTEPQAL